MAQQNERNDGELASLDQWLVGPEAVKEAEHVPPSELASEDPALSDRAEALVKGDAMPLYILAHFERLGNLYSSSNPNGYIPLSIAENRLMFDLLGPKLQECRHIGLVQTSYQDMRGLPLFRRVLALFMQKHVLGIPVNPNDLYLSNGAGSTLNVLFWSLCNPGDGVLLPTPYYAGFVGDAVVIPGAKIIPVPTQSSLTFQWSVADLEAAYRSAEREGVRPKALLLCSPNNPLGFTFSKALLEEVLEWAANKPDLHIICDEIYKADRTHLRQRVHVVYGFAKDFAMSGFRVGICWSLNRRLARAFPNVAYYHSVSNDTQFALANMLADRAFVELYKDTLQRRLRHSYVTVTSALEEAGIPFLPANHGIFFMVNLRKWLPADSLDGETKLWRHLVNKANVNLTPGLAMNSPQHGWFRVCFAAVSPEALKLAVQRIQRELAQLDWMEGGEEKQPEDVLKGTLQRLERCKFKLDHFESIYRIEKLIEGAPNFRQVNCYPVFGTGQPSLQGFEGIWKHVQAKGFKKIVWVCVRQEPVIYVKNWSFAPRDPHNLNENMHFQGLKEDHLDQCQTFLARKALEASVEGNRHAYYRDTFAENPVDRKNMKLFEENVTEGDIFGLKEMYTHLREARGFNIHYARLLIPDERSPTPKGFDTIVRLTRSLDEHTALFFNCQMGKGRTTCGTICAALVLDSMQPRNIARLSVKKRPSGAHYRMIEQLLATLPGAAVAKVKLDEIIDQAAHLQNLRDIVDYTKQMFDKNEGQEGRRAFWKRMSGYFVERYFYLICFAVYVQQAAPSFAQSFQQWVKDHADTMEILSNELPTFDWK